MRFEGREVVLLLLLLGLVMMVVVVGDGVVDGAKWQLVAVWDIVLGDDCGRGYFSLSSGNAIEIQMSKSLFRKIVTIL